MKPARLVLIGLILTAGILNAGQEIWRVNREEIDTWPTPFVLEVNGRAQAIVPGIAAQ